MRVANLEQHSPLLQHWGVATQLVQRFSCKMAQAYFADLIDATTTFNSVHEWGATYYFTINVPQQAEPSR